MWNTADPSDNDYARFYVWVEPAGYFGTTTISMGPGAAREWELMNIDFTDYAAGQSQVYFYLEANFGTGSFTRECKFDDIGIGTATAINVEEKRYLPEDFSIAAYPNPFNSAVTITIDGVGAYYNTPLQVEIFDLAGRRVETVSSVAEPVEAVEVPGGFAMSGATNTKLPSTSSVSVFIWHPDASISSGVYLVRARFDSAQRPEGEETATKRVVYLK